MVKTINHHGKKVEYQVIKLQERGKAHRRDVIKYEGHQFDTSKQFAKFLSTGVVKDNAR